MTEVQSCPKTCQGTSLSVKNKSLKSDRPTIFYRLFFTDKIIFLL